MNLGLGILSLIKPDVCVKRGRFWRNVKRFRSQNETAAGLARIAPTPRWHWRQNFDNLDGAGCRAAVSRSKSFLRRFFSKGSRPVIS
jgi:hypothetical protein